MRIWNAGSNVYELRIVEILRLTNRIPNEAKNRKLNITCFLQIKISYIYSTIDLILRTSFFIFLLPGSAPSTVFFTYSLQIKYESNRVLFAFL